MASVTPLATPMLSRRSGEHPPENFEIIELIWCILAYMLEDFLSKWGLDYEVEIG